MIPATIKTTLAALNAAIEAQFADGPGITATPISDTQIDLNLDNPEFKNVEIRYTDAAKNIGALVNAGDMAYQQVINLSGDTRYYFAVRFSDAPASPWSYADAQTL